MLIIYATLLVFVLSSTVIANETEPKTEPKHKTLHLASAILHKKTALLTDNFYYRILGEDSKGPIFDNEAIKFYSAKDGSGIEGVSYYEIENTEPGKGPICHNNRLGSIRGKMTDTKPLVVLNKDKKLLRLEGLWGRDADKKVGGFDYWP
ncbi:hypothetical protein F5887DRAFT_424893 [Amanita rubescens]|nr:hypothetical protein F5887DRAFT_424893 [Amanita rubescens]